jgi:hypothetical protein
MKMTKMTKSEAGRLGGQISKEASNELKKARVNKYLLDPLKCKNCSGIIPYEKKILKNTFCSHTCSAIYSHSKRAKNSKPIKKCIQCDGVLKGATSKYCSTVCQKDFQRMKTIKDKTASARSSKFHLISIHGHKCLDPLCVWDFSKRPLVVELEHIDGNSENNSLENLTLLCPNCHSLSPTYKN